MVKIHGFEQEERIIHLLVAKGTEAMLDADLDEEEVIPVSIATWIVDEIEEDQMNLQHLYFLKCTTCSPMRLKRSMFPIRLVGAQEDRDHQGGYRSVDGEVYVGELEIKGDLPA